MFSFKPKNTAAKRKVAKVTEPFATVKDAVDVGSIQSLLAENSGNDGNLRLKGGLKVDGNQSGDIVVSDPAGIVWVTKAGKVKGDIQAAHVYIEGQCNGTVKAEIVVLQGDARVEGRIFTDKLVLRDQNGLYLAAEIRDLKAAREVDSKLPGQLVPISIASASSVAA